MIMIFVLSFIILPALRETKKQRFFSSASPARWWIIFAQPKGPTIMLEG